MITGKHISDYMEGLCREHCKVGHTDSECHYVNLNDDKRQTAQATLLRYPAVMFETAGYVTQANGDGFTKRHQCHLQVVTHVTDTGDYGEIERALAECDGILTDFLTRMLADKRRRTPRWMTGMDIGNAEVIPVENRGDALYGVLAEFYLPEQICTINDNFSKQ